MSVAVDTSVAPALRLVAPRPAPTSDVDLVFTFDVQTGALRRGVAHGLAEQLRNAGLDVSWSDRRVGVLGSCRRFTVRGPRPMVQQMIAAVGAQLGWQSGAVVGTRLG